MMKNMKVELVVIGAGPGGLAATIEACRHGMDVLLIDENSMPGGQYLCQPENSAWLSKPMILDKKRRVKQRIFGTFSNQNIPVLYNTTVLWIMDHCISILTDNSELDQIEYEALIIAPGAYDMPVPFPGWTLPGVLSAGGALALMKRQGVLPGNQITIAGRGFILISLAAELIAAGANVVNIFDATSIDKWFKTLCKCSGRPDMLLEGLIYWMSLLRGKTKFSTSKMVTDARGENHLEEVIVSEVDENCRPIQGTEESYNADSLCLGFGFVPSSELFRAAGCKGIWDPSFRAWMPIRDENMQTSLPGVYGVGDGAGPRGAEIAEIEGNIAGLSAAHRLGHLSEKEWVNLTLKYRSKLARRKRFRDAVDALFCMGRDSDSLMKEDTIICRCEDVTFGDVMQAIHQGARDLNTIKGWTRAGMGRCQGRNCGSTIAYLLYKYLNSGQIEFPVFNTRFPVKPVPFASFDEMKIA